MVNSVSERKIVARGDPLNSICELGAKPEPITASVKVVAPAATLAGLSVLMAGLGKLITPPQDARSKTPSMKTPAEIFLRRLKFFCPSSLSNRLSPVDTQRQPERLLEMTESSNWDVPSFF